MKEAINGELAAALHDAEDAVRVFHRVLEVAKWNEHEVPERAYREAMEIDKDALPALRAIAKRYRKVAKVAAGEGE